MSKEEKHNNQGWSCTHCTFKNTEALPLCSVCKLARPVIWKCVICMRNNYDHHKCQGCGISNPEFDSERPKWMRNHDDTWNCMDCTSLNDENATRCNVCGIGEEKMQLDNTMDQKRDEKMQFYERHDTHQKMDEKIQLHKPLPTYACKKCTFENPVENLKCSVCDTWKVLPAQHHHDDHDDRVPSFPTRFIMCKSSNCLAVIDRKFNGMESDDFCDKCHPPFELL